MFFVAQTENPPRDQQAETPRRESPEDMHKALRFTYVTPCILFKQNISACKWFVAYTPHPTLSLKLFRYIDCAEKSIGFLVGGI